MRIILDTDKKTITVPWNYSAKLEEMNNLIMQITNDPSKKKTFSGYLKECWDEAMSDTDKNLKTAQKPAKPKKDEWDMAKRVTPEEIVEMHRLYAKYGNFAAVGRELGRSGSTVAKYIRMKGTPDIVKHTFKEVMRGA